ncbi:tRNA:m4X modification enzyme [Entomortierella parvispora]|uniref:tRNA:m(4)X modification enzyme TRM13 n=1 Tax=Entomortierella parvispora TaxID=205924 RepID=A0A9P3LSJ8_9FUNG|nr:tRNA:m4X modification enzyme [Entomortierella parvispora]
MSDSKRPITKDPEPVVQALAGTLTPPVLHPRNKNKRQKTQAPPPPVPDRPRQCHFLLPSKRKYCSLQCKIGNKFCGEHSMFETVDPVNETEAQEGQTAESKQLRERIPCPFDPSHTAWADDLRAHLFKCNARPKDAPAQFKLDANLTLPAPEKASTTSSANEAYKGGSEVLSTLSDEELMALIKKIQDLHAKYVPEIKTMILDHPALDERKKVTKNIKHAHQQASLIGHMERLKMLDDKTTCFVEFGAGRGELSNYLKVAVDDHGTHTFVLVDRTPPRNKFDSALLGLEEIKSLVKRHTMDIKDLDLSQVPEIRQDVTATQREIPKNEAVAEEITEGQAAESAKDQEYVAKKPVVAVSKHLCGGATDITLKCLANYQDSERKHSQLYSPVKGILIALCCHQLCHHYMYPNQEYLKEIGISAKEFVYLTRMSSWGVCVNQTKQAERTESRPATPSDTQEASTNSSNSTGAGDDEHEVLADKELDELSAHIPTLDFQGREKLGLQCKRLLDIGRVRYLKENGFDAELVYYVDKETSLENLALMAVPSSLSL